MDNNQWLRYSEFYDDLIDYKQPKDGIRPEEFWPTIRRLREDGLVYFSGSGVHKSARPLDQEDIF